MKFSDNLLNAVKGILEAKPRVSFDGDKATVHDKTGKEIKTFNRKDLGGNFRREADSYMAKNYRSLNQAYEPKGESIEEAKQLELPGMGGDKQPELNLKKKDESPIKKVKEAVDPDDEGDVEIIDEKKKHKKLDPVGKEDGDIDNDGDMDKSDEYLHNRRKAIKSAMKKEEVEVDEAYRGKGGGYHYPDAVKKHEKMKLKPKYTPAEIEKMDKQKLKDAQNEEVEVDEAKMVPGFIGADGKATSKPTEKDYAANKEYQAMKKKLGDRIPGPKSVNKNKEKYPGLQGEENLYDAYEIADLIIEMQLEMQFNEEWDNEKLGQTKNYVVRTTGDYGHYKIRNKKTGERHHISVDDHNPFNRTRHVKRDLQKNHPEVGGADRHALAKHINRHMQDSHKKVVPGSKRSINYAKKIGKTTGEVRRDLKKDGESRVSFRNAMYGEENEPTKANGGIAHNCATHVSHEEFGLGQCISGMHTIEENEDGTGYVTHYDVMFKSEEGPFIKESVPVEELEILISEKHMHGKKKTVESNEYTDQLADRIRDVEDKKKRKKAEKAFNSGDYEKASKHAGVTYWEK